MPDTKPLDPEALKPEEPKARRARPDRAPSRPEPRMSARRLEREVGGLLVMVNLGLASTPLRDDVLDADEIALLTQGLVAQAESSARFRRYLEAAVKAQGGSLKLVTALALIVGRRVARRRLPEAEAAEADARIAGLIGFMVPHDEPAAPAPARRRRRKEEEEPGGAVEPEPSEPALALA